tara:strand:+ start:477534 stop:478826 length:1293 start_codon:yes stop_codon:yes gene_type:complete
MVLKKYILFIAITVLLISCDKNDKQITNTEDYQSYLTSNDTQSIAFAEAEKEFWKAKHEAAPNQVSYLGPLAASHSTLFEYNGTIDDLKKSEAYLVEANKKRAYKSASLLRALAKNYISQHRFKEALALLNSAFVLGEKKLSTQKMLFDVYLELGDEPNASKNLAAIKDLNDFDYLIRLSKWLDHQGDLDAAIAYLEKAKLKAEGTNSESLMLWSYSNLADFYGHAGNIKVAYKYYLKALAIDSNYTYALRGIAWIVFSHEKNSTEAANIINAIAKKHNTPDLQLFKADLAEFENDTKSQEIYLQNYLSMVNNKSYGAMYTSYNALIYADSDDQIDTAIALATQEIENRPTAHSYDLLAWAYHKKGASQKALDIIQNHVVNKTFEPVILYHMAEIYKANGMGKFAMKIKKELLESAFEIGPLMSQKVHKI